MGIIRALRFSPGSVAVVLISIQAAQGETRTWDGGGTTDSWGESLNWSENSVPAAGDDAVTASGTPRANFTHNVRSLNNSVTIFVEGALGVNTGPVVNAGTILIDNGPTPGNAVFGIGPGVLSGDGEVLLTDSDFDNQGARLSGVNSASPESTTHAAGHLIRGEGTIDGNWVNQSEIRAEETSGDATAVLKFGAGTVTNEGLITSTPTAAIVLDSSHIVGAAGGHFVANTIPVFIASATFTGGELEATGGATYEMLPFSGVQLNGATVPGVFNAKPTSGNATVSSSSGGFTNNGVITFDSVANGLSRLSSNFAFTVSGTGEMVFRREANTGITGFTTITNGAGHTMRGVGTFQPQGLVNNGTILAQPQDGSVLTVSPSNLTNNGLLQANSGATLRILSQTQQDNATGRIRAADGGTVVLAANIFSGGKLQTEGTGKIEVSEAMPSLQNITNEGTFNVRAGRALDILAGTITNNGVITINSDDLSVGTVLEFEENATLAGSGSLVLNRNGALGAVVLADNANVVVTHGTGHTIRGDSAIGSTLNRVNLVNHGRLEGDAPDALLNMFGILSGDGALENVQVHFVHLAGGPGTTAVVPLEESYVLSNVAQIQLDIAGAAAGSGYDQLNSTGTIAIGPNGTLLDVDLAGGFEPSFGQIFTLLKATGGITGSFDNVSLPTPPPELAWIRAQTATELTLRTTWAADFDEDFDVDDLDLAKWRTGFGPSGKSHLQGDADGDGDADGADFMVWQRQFGIQPVVADSMPAPEPTSYFLALAAMSIAARLNYRSTWRKGVPR